MSKVISASINLDKIDQSLIIQGKKGRYVNLSIWLNDKPDKYGNDISVQQKTEKGKPKIYIGEGRSYSQSELPVGNNVISEEQL